MCVKRTDAQSTNIGRSGGVFAGPPDDRLSASIQGPDSGILKLGLNGVLTKSQSRAGSKTLKSLAGVLFRGPRVEQNKLLYFSPPLPRFHPVHPNS